MPDFTEEQTRAFLSARAEIRPEKPADNVSDRSLSQETVRPVD